MASYGRRSYLGAVAGGAALALGYPAGRLTRAERGQSLDVIVSDASGPVDAGEALSVTARLENVGDEDVAETVRLEVGEEVVDTDTVTLAAGEVTTTTLGYETAAVARTTRFPVTVTAGTDTAERVVTVFGTEDPSIARIGPADEIAVQPGSTVLFEAAVSDPVEAEWYVDDDGPLSNLEELFFGSVTTHLNRAALSPTFETTGTREVRVVADDSAVGWTVDVDPDGSGPPSIETLSSEPGEDETAGSSDTLEVTTTVSHPDGGLGSVLWFEPGNAIVVDESDVSDDRDTATLSRPIEDAYWIERGYETTAAVVSDAGVVGDVDSVPGPDVRPPFAVEIADANDPVDAGDVLEVTAEVRNEGGTFAGEGSQEIELAVGGEVVDTDAVTLGLGETTTVTLGYETATVRRDVEFPVTIASPDDLADRTVRVFGVE